MGMAGQLDVEVLNSPVWIGEGREVADDDVGAGFNDSSRADH